MPIPTAAYCRVSTEREDQRQSLESQICYFRDYIDARPQLSLVEVYSDRGLSGTTVRSRAAFSRLLADCEAGRVGLVLTKEVSRFARNTVDALSVTRRLRALGVGVVFLSDGIDTRDGDGELRLAILASIAQEESRRISQRVRWGQQRRMEAGVVFGNPCIYGYRLAGGALHIEPAQAAVVAEMFRRCAGGASTRAIAAWLNQAGILPLRAAVWSSGSVSRILHNEKYTGDLLQKKSVTPDYLSHRRQPNRGQEPQVLLPDHHEAIVSRELFLSAQQALRRRGPCTGKTGRIIETTQIAAANFSQNERANLREL